MTSQTEITVNWETLTEWVITAPEWVNQVFACDCAERALRRYEDGDYELWELLETTRKFIEGRSEYTSEFMFRQWNRAVDIARCANHDSRRVKLSVMWACVSYNVPHGAIEAAKAGGELDWAILHFLHLLKEYNAARSALITVISARADVVMRTITEYAHSLEERVFE